jgi:hypothetical protein
MKTWLRRLFTHKVPAKQGKARLRARLQLEHLEDRRVMSVTYHGGGLLPHVEVQGLYVGDQWSSNPSLNNQCGYLEGFLHKIVDSTYMDALSNAGYGVGRGSSSGGIISLASLAGGSTLTDSTLRSWLGSYAASGALQSPDANRLYVCFAEPNIIVQAWDGSTSTSGFRGYHGAFWNSSTNSTIHYAIIAYPRGWVGNGGVSFLSDLDSITKTASHEIAEAATDANAAYSTLGWYDDDYKGEIGDINNDRVMYVGGYAMQRVINQHDFNMTPAEATPKRSVSFVLQNSGNLVEVVGGVPTTVITGSVASLSDQGIDNQGHAMVDIVDTSGRAWEFHDGSGGWTYLDCGIASAKAGQGVSYLLYNDGTIREYDDAAGTLAYIYSNGVQIDAGTDVQGANMVDIVFKGGAAWEHSDDRGWSYIASSVSRISAGRQGVSEYVTSAAEGHWHSETGLDATVAWNVSQITAGTDQYGNYMIDVLYQTGRIDEYRVGSGWSFVYNYGQYIGKANDGVLSIVFTWGAAYNHDSGGWYFLTSNAVTSA